jgi:signal transduction histidine kinase
MSLQSKSGLALRRSLARLRDGLEQSMVDDLIAAGGLKLSRLKLLPVLAEAREHLLTIDRKVKVLVEKPAQSLQIQADPRLVGPAVRSLLRAALEVARPGSTIRFTASPARDRARVAVSVDRLRGKGLPDLTFVRRAVRAHGGTVSTHASPRDGFELRLELPRVQPH